MMFLFSVSESEEPDVTGNCDPEQKGTKESSDSRRSSGVSKKGARKPGLY
jgi:hypothetical protein